MLDSKKQYLDSLAKHHLSQDELEALRVKGDEEAMNTLWLQSMPLVAHIAGNLQEAGRIHGVDYLDAVQEGNIAARSAIERWKPGRGRFTTFLWPRIAGAMIRYASSKGRVGGMTGTLYGSRAVVVTEADLPAGELVEPPVWDVVHDGMSGEDLMKVAEYYLSRTQMEVLFMYYFKGLTVTEISEHRECSTSSTSQTLHRAVRALTRVIK